MELDRMIRYVCGLRNSVVQAQKKTRFLRTRSAN